MTRTQVINENLMLRQTDPNSSSIVVAPKTITDAKLSVEIRNGLIPLGAIFPVMSNISGAYQPGVSGLVEGGFIRCDGAAIPAGMKVTGATPNLTTDNYLRGSSSSGTIGGSNTTILNTPQLPLHTHDVTMGYDNIPHAHSADVSDNGTGTHNHTNISLDVANAPHSHTSSSDAPDSPHAHPASGGYGDSQHAHPASTGAVSNPHSHPITHNAANAPHSHSQYNIDSNPGSPSSYWGDIDNFTDGARFTQGIVSGYANMPHGHSVSLTTSNNPHPHTITVSANTAPHTHTSNSGTANNPHTHTLGDTNTGNIPHGHPTTLNIDNAPHTHVITVLNKDTPHTHVGSAVGSTGSGSSFNKEPQYIECIYVMRVR